MNQLVRLGMGDAHLLYHFLSKYKQPSLIKMREKFLTEPDGICLAIIDDHEQIKQILLAEIKDQVMITHAIKGEFGDWSSEMLDQLCAICSSCEPMIVDHRVKFDKDDITDFKNSWDASRLGEFSVDLIYEEDNLKAKIDYPA